MATKIRLQRHGKKGQPFYHIVVVDGRAPRDGRYIERIGTYNPLTNPATVVLNFDRALYWVNCGAESTDTARSLLRGQGVYMKKHLMGGVAKGAFSETEAEAKFAAWKEAKDRRLSDCKTEAINASRAEMKVRLEAEAKVKEARAAVVAEKRQAIAEKERQEREAAEAAEAAAKAEAEGETPVAAEEAPATEEAPAEAEAQAETEAPAEA
ncbi:MAG: 30S ribosomal protein S16 [Bacteroidales bacterium]|nr:30S ribosomal protein S16 [Bacteroidales bacterium]